MSWRRATWLSPLVGAVALVATALGHGEGVLDLEGLETLVARRAVEAASGEQPIYRRLDRALQREVERAFFDEIRKLSTVAAACRKWLAGDGELVALLREGLGQAEAYLDGRDEQVDAIARGLERAEDREATARVAEKALAQLAAARAQTSDVARGKGLRRCGTTWVRAEKLAHKLLLRQLRRGAPGQPVTKGPTGSIDTYAGTGAQGVDPQPRSALASSFSNPVDVAIDGDGRLYVVDLNNNRSAAWTRTGWSAPWPATGASAIVSDHRSNRSYIIPRGSPSIR